jgi:CubicO group peptidase (beta-lactamase class C family)
MPHTIDSLQRGIEQGLHTAAQVHVIHRGQVVLDHCVGPITTDHLMLWMSAGKPLAAVAILQLLAIGRIELSTKVADVIDGFGVNGKHDITLLHLLNHTAGFRGPMNNFSPGLWEQLIARVCQLKQEPNWLPGQKAGYHIGSSWFILGELVRVLSELPFNEYVQRFISPEIFVGMTPEQLEHHRPMLVTLNVTDASNKTPFAGNTDEAILVPRPGANARGPIRELARFYQRLLDSTRGQDDLLPQDIAMKMTTRQRVGEHQYGFGPAASASTFGHSGNQSSCAFVDPANDLVVAWATDGMPGEPAHQQRQRDINAAVYRDIANG